MENRIIKILLIALFVCGCDKTKPLDNSPAVSTPPTTPGPTLNTKSLGGGGTRSFAINASGVMKSWGGNYDGSNDVYGLLAQNIATNTVSTTPQLLGDAGTNYSAVAIGETNGCGITSAGKIKCWGQSNGDGTGVDSHSPGFINDGGNATYIDVASGSYHSCGINSVGVMSCWGDGWEGKLGNGDGTGANQNSPVIADSGTTYKRVAAGRNHTCGITVDGALKCFGTNSNGQLGDTTLTSPRVSAVTIDAGINYAEIAAGEDTTCGITTTGVLKCWGENGVGQVGNNTTLVQSTPVVIDSGTSYKKVSTTASRGLHTCGITTAGVLKCWGDNASGQLGDGTTTRSLVPITIDSGISYKDVVSAGDATCGVTVAGQLKCWGINSAYELGLGNTSVHLSPTLVGSGY
jgi:alpha-tubulin suppressor-like RCC1 family protein